MVVFVAAIFVLAVVYSVFSSTIVGTNINTEGTLTVSGASRFNDNIYASSNIYATSTLQASGDIFGYANIYASSTVQATGNILAYASLGVGGTSSPTVGFGVVGSGFVSSGFGVGEATSSGFKVRGLAGFRDRVGVNASSSPYQELGVTGDVAAASSATTTLSLESTGNAGGCIELKTSAARGTGGIGWIRIYAGSGIGTTTMSVPAAGFGLVIEEGRCQSGP